jgi:hypothetical protein
MEIIYKIDLDNYHGESNFELYHNKNNARARFKELLAEGRRKSEFNHYEDEDEFSYFDSNYNEFSTYITLKECALDELFYD